MEGTIVMDTHVLERIARQLENVSQAMSEIKLPVFGTGMVVNRLMPFGVTDNYSMEYEGASLMTRLQSGNIVFQAARARELAGQCHRAAVLIDNCENRLLGKRTLFGEGIINGWVLPGEVLTDNNGGFGGFEDFLSLFSPAIAQTAHAEIVTPWGEEFGKASIKSLWKVLEYTVKENKVLENLDLSGWMGLLGPLVTYGITSKISGDYNSYEALGKMMEGAANVLSKITLGIKSNGLTTFISTTAGAIVENWEDVISGEKGWDEAIVNAVGQGAVKAGSTVAIGVAVAAGAAAFGVTAPAAAVVLAAGIVYTGADALVKCLTTKSITDWGGEIVESGYKQIKQEVKHFVQDVGDCVQTVSDTVGKGTKAVWNFFTRGLSFA